MCGLDQAGKTTILKFIQTGEHYNPRRTLGFTVQKLTINNLQLKVQDLGGQVQFRKTWYGHLRYSQAIIYVIDASNRDRFEESASELLNVVESMPKTSQLLILAHKQDLENAAGKEEVIHEFNLTSMEKKWHFLETSAVTGEGLRDIVIWLYETLTGKKLPSPTYRIPVRCFEEHRFSCILRITGDCDKKGYESCYTCDHAHCQNCDNCNPECFL